MSTSLRELNRLRAMEAVRRTAFEQMSAHGFAAVTVEQIASAASVSPSTVYRYFGTKEALVLNEQRSVQLVERIADDASERAPLASLAKAAAKVWGSDESVGVELGLLVANPALLEAWERQLVGQRENLAAALARRRGVAEPDGGDRAQAAASIAVFVMLMPSWLANGGGKKSLEKSLNKAFASLH